MITAEGDTMIGLTVGGWAVLFGRKGEVAGPVQYAAPAGRPSTWWWICGEARYKLDGGDGRLQDLTVSAEGTLPASQRDKQDW